MDRKPIFDTVRTLLDRGFRPAEVVMLDEAIDRALSPPGERPLGALSERFESGGRGAGAVSGGQGDPGGVSYGIWQLSSRAGVAAAFVATEGDRWADEFAGTRPGSPAFGAAWRRIALREPGDFAAAQHAFVARSHYRPVVAAVHRSTGLDIESRHRAVRDAVWSTAVQHGAATRVLIAAIASADADLTRAAAGYDRRLVEAIYAERSTYVSRIAARSGAAARRLLETVVRSRYPAERAEALAMFTAHG